MALYENKNLRVSIDAGTFNPPDISDTGKVRNKPIANVRQAHDIYSRFEKDNIARSLRNKVITDKYNLMPPYRQEELDSTGQGWRANFHTGFIGSINDRITPRLTDTVHGMKYLTNSRIPDNWPDADSHTQRFREHVTNVIRSWIGWNDFLDQLASEVGYFGYSAAIQTGQYDWRPKTFRQDEMYFDEHSRQHAAELPVFCVRKSYFVHQLVDMISDDETNEEIGYKVSNIAGAIRSAAAPVLRPNVDLRLLSDIVREGSLYYSYHRSVRMIESVHMFCADYDAQGIEHWWFNRKRETPSRQVRTTPLDRTGKGETIEDNDPILFLHESYDDMAMEDFITLFTFQAGNNRLYGSKGVGRMIANLDTALNRVRMSAIDSVFISQMLVGQTDESVLARMMPTVRFPFMWLPEGAALLSQQFQVQIDNYLQLDNQLKAMAEIVVGAYLPDQTQLQNQMPETATAEAIDAQREEEVKQGTLNRWWRQVTEMIQSMQRRLCNSVNLQLALDIFEKQQEAIAKGKQMVSSREYDLMIAIDGDLSDLYEPMPKLGRGDPDAIDMLLHMFEDGLTPPEIIVAAHARSTEPTQLTGAKEIVNFQQFYQAMKTIQNPNFDWDRMDEILSIDSIGASRTKEVYIGKSGQVPQMEQARQQMLELGALMAGDQVPVSPRDDHMTHLGVLMPKISTQIQTMKATPPATISQDELPSVGRQIDHAKGHVAALEVGNKVPRDQLSNLNNQIKEAVTEMSLISDARIKDMALAAAVQQRQQAQIMNQPFEPEPTMNSPTPGTPVVTPQITEDLAKERDKAVKKAQTHNGRH